MSMPRTASTTDARKRLAENAAAPEPTVAGREALLAIELHATENPGATPGRSCAECRRTARIVLASDAHARMIAAEKAEALTEAADFLEGRLGVEGTPKTLWDFRAWLRARAAAIEARP